MSKSTTGPWFDTYGTPTVRRHPRSTAEAFPVERRDWFEDARGFRMACVPKRTPMTREQWIDIGHRVVGYASIGILIGIVAALLVRAAS